MLGVQGGDAGGGRSCAARARMRSLTYTADINCKVLTLELHYSRKFLASCLSSSASVVSVVLENDALLDPLGSCDLRRPLPLCNAGTEAPNTWLRSLLLL